MGKLPMVFGTHSAVAPNGAKHASQGRHSGVPGHDFRILKAPERGLRLDIGRALRSLSYRVSARMISGMLVLCLGIFRPPDHMP